MFRNPDVDRLRALLREVRTIAVVGLSPKPDRPSHGVSKSMQSFGYRIVPVNPGQAAVLGETCYATLRDIPEGVRAGIDLVDVFRQADAVPAIVGVGLWAIASLAGLVALARQLRRWFAGSRH